MTTFYKTRKEAEAEAKKTEGTVLPAYVADGPDDEWLVAQKIPMMTGADLIAKIKAGGKK